MDGDDLRGGLEVRPLPAAQYDGGLAAYDLNFSISAIAPPGALTFPSWIK
jgi:hypothetical protein